MNILIAEPMNYSADALSIYQSIGNVQLGNEINFTSLLRESDVLVVRLRHHLSRQQLQDAHQLKYIVSPTTGLDHIDLEFCKASGINVLSLQGETAFLDSITATAEHSFALILSLLRKIPDAVKHVREGKWNRNLFIGNTLAGKTIGIIGMGRVGQQVANMAVAFGMQTRYYDIRAIQLNQSLRANCIAHDDVESVISKSDIISIHIPLQGNENFFSEKLLSLFDNSKYLVNTSRGKIVNETFLLGMLRRGEIAGVALDVIADEINGNISPESPLISAMNQGLPLIVTPHIGGATVEAMHDTEVFMAQKLKTAIQYP